MVERALAIVMPAWMRLARVRPAMAAAAARAAAVAAIFAAAMAVASLFCACGGEIDMGSPEETDDDVTDDVAGDRNRGGVGSDGTGGGNDFRIPLPQGFDWEVSQSWGEHCELCDEKYPDDSASYCDSSHATLASCKYGWDFNLPGSADEGKPALATASGTVKIAEERGSWGNTVVVDHGSGICSRYAHLDSINVSKGDDVCRGLVLGKIGNTGYSSGSHLHFQFENCTSGEGLEMGFTDGNGIPKCTKGSDIYDEDGYYTALLLTNKEKDNCDGSDDDDAIDDDNSDDDNELPNDGWVDAECGDLTGCPLVHDCNRSGTYDFPDSDDMSAKGKDAVSYLWRECALDGNEDDNFHPSDDISRAEVLKISLSLFGLTENCNDLEPFSDVNPDDWFYPYVVCAVVHRIIDSGGSEFHPNNSVTFAEAAKMTVLAAAEAHIININHPGRGHFPSIPESHWAYEYAETLYSYGAIDGDPADIDPDERITRETYAIMVASLSPCFCWNINCESGCECSQKEFACTDSDGNGEGGGDDDADDDAQDDDLSDDDLSDDDVDDDDAADDDDFVDDDNMDDDAQDDDLSDDDLHDDDISDDDIADDDLSDDDISDDDEDSCATLIVNPEMVWISNYGYFYLGVDLVGGEPAFRLSMRNGGYLCYTHDSHDHCQEVLPCQENPVSPPGLFLTYAWLYNTSSEYPVYPNWSDAMILGSSTHCASVIGDYNYAVAD